MPLLRIDRAFPILILLLPLSGCGGSKYELTLEPEGNSLSRTLVFNDGNPPEAEKEAPAVPPKPSAEVLRLAAVFDTDAPTPVEGDYRFKGTFTDVMPDDVGGAGRFSRRETSLGSLCVYVERFRGSYELAELVERRFGKVETLTDVLAQWVRTSGKESPLRDRLEHVVSEDLQRDLKNVVLLAMTAGESPREQEQLYMHLGQYLAERSYLDLDTVLHAAAGGDSEANALSLLQNSFSLKLEVPKAELLEIWPSLADLETFKDSLDAFVETTEAYRRYVEKTSEAAGRDEAPEGSEFLGSLMAEIIGLDFAAGDSVKVALQCPHEPLLSNGLWLADESRITWNLNLPKRDSPSPAAPPDLCYAVWSEPNSAFQQQHFGQTLLTGEALATYCTWRVSLEKEEGARWDRFLESLAGGENLEAAVSQFKFPGSRKSQSPAAQQIERTKELFQNALQREAESE